MVVVVEVVQEPKVVLVVMVLVVVMNKETVPMVLNIFMLHHLGDASTALREN